MSDDTDEEKESNDLVELIYTSIGKDGLFDCRKIHFRNRSEELKSLAEKAEFGEVIFKGAVISHAPSFILIDPNINCRKLIENIVMQYEVLPPNLVLSLIANHSDPRSFKLRFHRENFITGIQNVIDSTSVWVLTHGRSCGIVKLVGEAFHRQQDIRASKLRWNELLRKPVTSAQNLILIGIVDEKSVLDNGGDFIQVSGRNVLEMTKIKDSFFLDYDHTLFIIVKDNKNGDIPLCCGSAAESFRCRFEKYIYTNEVPKLNYITQPRAMKPRDIEVTKYKTTDRYTRINLTWKNPYHTSKYRSVFENFEAIVKEGDTELKRVPMLPRGECMTCVITIHKPHPPALWFAVQTKTLYGKSEEAKCILDLSKDKVERSLSQFGKLFKKERRKTRTKSFFGLTIEMKCVPTSTEVAVEFTPYFSTTYHDVILTCLDDPEYRRELALDAGSSLCYFTGLKPNTTYKVQISPIKSQNGDHMLLAGPFESTFRTKEQEIETILDCTEREGDIIYTPFIYMISGGSFDSISKIRHSMETKTSAMISLCGTGGAADIINAVVDLFKNKPSNDEVRCVIMEVAEKLVRNELVLEETASEETEATVAAAIHDLVQIGKYCQRKKRIKMVNIWNTKLELERISKELLKAWISGGGQRAKTEAAFERDLKLAVDLNNSNLAESEIFDDPKYKSKVISAHIFEKALLSKNRESFVNLFLENKFQLHTYLTESKLKYIFEYEDDTDPYDRDFFITTTVEGIMGLTGDEDKLPDEFISQELPKVIRQLTGMQTTLSFDDARIIFLPRPSRSMWKREKIADSSTIIQKMKEQSIAEREREALKMLTVYAVLMNRYTLAKYLWKHSPTPILTALFCAAVYNRLSHYCHESYQKTLAEKYSRGFTDLAVKLLDLSFTENEQITHEGLQCKYPEWNDRSPIEFAHGVDNKEFMAHPSCQKWITRTYFGEITLRELTAGSWHTPGWIKILSCAFLIFPMYFWVNFSPIGKGNTLQPKSRHTMSIKPLDNSPKSQKPDDDVDEEKPRAYVENNAKEHVVSTNDKHGRFMSQAEIKDFKRMWSLMPSTKSSSEVLSDAEKKKSIGKIQMSKTLSHFRRSKTLFLNRLHSSPPLWKKILLFWGAPVTKFCTDAFFYAMFLMLFSVATIWPTCGNIYLDTVFWIWTTSITFEHARLIYAKSRTFNHLPLRMSIIDVLIQTVFLFLFVVIKIYGVWEGWSGITPHTAKSLMGCFLIYFFIRVFKIYYPIHAKLGPAMVKLTYMLTDDFVSYLYVFVVFMISVGVAATAIIYPHHPLNSKLFKTILKRGIMALFRTDTRDLEAIDPSVCKINITRSTCLRLSGSHCAYKSLSMYSEYGIRDPDCAVSNWIVWVMVLQYGYMSSVFLRSLLTAMFGITGRNVSAKSDQIWMYDRYEIIMDYERKPRLPPPLSIISYLLAFFAYCYKMANDCSSCRNNTCRKRSHHSAFSEFVSMLSEFTRGDTSEWKNQTRWEDDESNLYFKLKAEKVLEQIEMKDKTNTNLKLLTKKTDIIQETVTYEKDLLLLLRNMSCELKIFNNQQLRYNVLDKGGRYNKFSRQSPYWYTFISRLNFPDSFANWEHSFPAYAPTKYNMELDQMLYQPQETVPTVMTTSSIVRDEVYVEPDADELSKIDANTWSLNSAQEHKFSLTNDGIPLNPLGRTGIAGKGCLKYWGPNKVLIIFLTKWRTLNKRVIIERNRRVMEFFSFVNLLQISWTQLPFAIFDEEKSAYGTVCQKLHPDKALEVSRRTNVDLKNFSQFEMIEFFKSLVSDINGNREADSDEETRSDDTAVAKGRVCSDLSISQIHKGYFDDCRNTDNAWLEAEIWNFHTNSTAARYLLDLNGIWCVLDRSNKALEEMGLYIDIIETLHQA